MIVPTLSISIRRLHVSGMSGWNQLWVLIPGIGFIIMIILWSQRTQSHSNRWAPIPGENDEEDDFVNSLVGEND